MDSRFHGNDIKGSGNDRMKEHLIIDSRLRGNDIVGRVFGEFYIFFSILQRPIIYLM